MWGVLAVGLFAEENRMAIAGYNSNHRGWFLSWGPGTSDANLLLANFVSTLWIIGWVWALMTPFFTLKYLRTFRVDPLEEKVGMDITHHEGVAYSMEGPKKEVVEEWREREEDISQHSKRGSRDSAASKLEESSTRPDDSKKVEAVEEVEVEHQP